MTRAIRHICSGIVAIVALLIMSAPAVACGATAESTQVHASASHSPCENPAPGDHDAAQNCKVACVALPTADAAEIMTMNAKAVRRAGATPRFHGVVLLLADRPPRMRA